MTRELRASLALTPLGRWPDGIASIARTALVALGLCGLAAPARAQIAVNKTEMVFHALPGEVKTVLINVHNEGSQRVQAVIRLEDWDRAPDGTNNWYQYGTKPGSCGQILSVFPLTVSLEPDAAQNIRVSLDSSATIDHECWAGAIVETVQPRTVDGRNVAYVIRTATKIYVQPPALAMKGEVVTLSIGATKADSAGDAGSEVLLEFENTGAKHLTTPGEVQFRRADNSIAATVKLPTLYTLPGAKSTTKIAVPKLAPGRYIVLAVLDYGGDELAAGQIEYEAKQ